MTKIIGFGRCFGKTTMAILESHATGNQIICANNRIAKHTSDYARQLGYTIPQPVAANDQKMPIITSNLNRAGLGIVVDDVEMVLRTLLGCKIDTITFASNSIFPIRGYVIPFIQSRTVVYFKSKSEQSWFLSTPFLSI